MIGLEHVALRTYLALLERFRGDNPLALARSSGTSEAGGEAQRAGQPLLHLGQGGQGGRLRVFLEAKGHPFHGEEFLDKTRDLYRGKHVYWFRAQPAFFHFMVLVCLDYLYRDLYGSNIRQVIDHADRQFFATRQTLDALFVLQFNPKPEHRAYRDVLAGFYGEYLEDTPGVRETITVFANSSEESEIGEPGLGGFGVSSVILGAPPPAGPGGGAGVLHRRLRRARRPAGSASGPPRGSTTSTCRSTTSSTRARSHQPLKVHAVLRPEGGGWVPVGGAPVMAELSRRSVRR